MGKLLAWCATASPRRFGLDPVRDVQVLCPMNRGGLGARSLNIELQKALNPPGEVRVERFGWTFGPGDKVMQVEQRPRARGLQRRPRHRAPDRAEDGELVVDFEGREIAYGFGELDELVLAYATTVHKSQGSEYPAVVIPLTTQHYPMLAAQPDLHRRDPGQAAGGAGRAEAGARDRGARRSRPAAAGRSCATGSQMQAKTKRLALAGQPFARISRRKKLRPLTRLSG